MNDIWQNVVDLIEPELRDHITLSAKDLNDMTLAALKSADPRAELGRLLNERGRARRDAREKMKAERMAEDIEKINRGAWPHVDKLPMKTQPWVTESLGRMKFGVMHYNDRLTVIAEDGDRYTFTSQEELVKVWSVD